MSNTMKAIVFYGRNNIRIENRNYPKIEQSTDAIIKLLKTTICGTDLGILKGKNPEITEDKIKNKSEFNGRILGHEGIGIVEDIGSSVNSFKKGDKVIISCISRCGICKNCKKQLYAHCLYGGWVLGYMLDGTQAEYVRIPFADASLFSLPKNMNTNAAVMFSDVLPTAYEVGIKNSKVSPGDTIAIIGSGPIGIGCVITAQLFSPKNIIVIDKDENRLHLANTFGATHTINANTNNVIEKIFEITNNNGVDCAIEAIGSKSTWDICQNIVKTGGHIANIGVHSQPVNFSLEKLWIKNLTITTGLVNTNTTEVLIDIFNTKKNSIDKIITHYFKFDDIIKAYDVFLNAIENKTMKIIINF